MYCINYWHCLVCYYVLDDDVAVFLEVQDEVMVHVAGRGEMRLGVIGWRGCQVGSRGQSLACMYPPPPPIHVCAALCVHIL